MKKYRVETLISLDNKLDVKEVIVEGDKYNEIEHGIEITAMIGQKTKKILIPWHNIKWREELME